MKKVIFICTGNTCRSPMAEAVFNHLVKRKGIEGIFAESCGVFTRDDLKMCDFASQALHLKGIEPNEHISRQMVSSMFDDCTLAVGMTQNHAMMASSYCDCECLSKYNSGEEISDPYGGDIETYQETLETIYFAVNSLIDNNF